MTKSKDIQIEELEDEVSIWKASFVVAVIFFMIFLSLWVFDIQAHPEFESQLQSCQEKVPVWTFTYHCEREFLFGFENKTITYTFNDYEDYLNSLNNFKKSENCEVLE